MRRTPRNTARTLAILAGIAGLALAAGCGNTQVQGTAAPPSEVEDNGPVRKPSDAVWKNVCEVATQAQISKYDLELGTGLVTDRGTPEERQTGCMWTVGDEPYSVHAGWSKSGGIADVIDSAERHQYPEVQELEIDGQKAVTVQTEAGGRSCLTYVGMDPQVAFLVQIVYEREATDRSQACPLSVKFAEEFAPNTTK